MDIGINPGNERYLQGYFLRDQERWLVKTVLGIYELLEDSRFEEQVDIDNIYGSDTIENPNTIDPSLRGIPNHRWSTW